MYCQFMTSKNELEPKILKNVHNILHYLYKYYQTKSNNVIKTKIS